MFLTMFVLFAGPAISADFVNRGFVTADDYPTASIRRNEEGATLSLVVVDPQGKVVRCETIVSSNHPLLDQAACKAIKRARAKPAKDRNGEIVYGAFKRWNLFFMPAPGSRPNSPFPESVDVEYIVNRLPDGSPPYAISVVNVVVDAQGTAESCDIAHSGGAPALDAIACDQGVRALHLTPIMVTPVMPVRSVQQFKIGFVVKPDDGEQSEGQSDTPITPPEPPAAHSSP
ncbi:MAG: TonB family protein [Sphingosinicella sp.]|nr:TonB family protein [Sphingosinicella sp.]